MKFKLFILIPLFFFSKLNGQSIYFPPLTGNTWDTLAPASLGWCSKRIDSLYNYLGNNSTKAFILLKDGKIVLEKYFGTHTSTSPWMWASAGKTITAFMVGIAQQEKYLSISEPSSKYLGKGWTICTTEQEDKITIRNQLTMTSGLDDDVADHYCTLDTCLQYKADAGTRWAYHNGPYTLLDKVIENATGSTLNNYTASKLKLQTGMTGTFYTVDYNHVFFSTARSMARFGLLILNKGNWNGKQIMTDTAYFRQMVNTSQNINQSYGYLWWLSGKTKYMLPGSQIVFNGSFNPNSPSDAVIAMGKDGQFLNVVPGKNLVWLRMGESPDGLPVPFLLNDKIWEYVNKLECNSLGDVLPENKESFHIYPNPVNDQIRIESKKNIQKIEILAINGQKIKEIPATESHQPISMLDLPAGLLFLRIYSKEYQPVVLKFFKQ